MMNAAAVEQYQSASHSHVGMVRQVNEDACLDAQEVGLWAVADGMGDRDVVHQRIARDDGADREAGREPLCH